MRAASAVSAKASGIVARAQSVTGLAIVALFGSPVVMPEPASGVDLHQSRLTTIDLERCKRIAKDSGGAAWTCPGLPGFPIYIVEGGLRLSMSFGEQPDKHQSARQTLGSENSIFEGKRRPTVEWRVERAAHNQMVPFATIVRYYTTRGSAKGEVLVITKVDQKRSCLVALVDVLANANPMALARMWANANVSRIECPEKPLVLGQHGKSPM
jgi:hypothetical protein